MALRLQDVGFRNTSGPQPGRPTEAYHGGSWSTHGSGLVRRRPPSTSSIGFLGRVREGRKCGCDTVRAGFVLCLSTVRRACLNHPNLHLFGPVPLYLRRFLLSVECPCMFSLSALSHTLRSGAGTCCICFWRLPHRIVILAVLFHIPSARISAARLITRGRP